MATSSKKQTTQQPRSWLQWVVGIPISLVVLVLLILIVQPWGEPRESITSTAPKDGDFYDPNSDQATVDLSDTAILEELSESENVQPRTGISQIVDVNLASWKPVDEKSVPEDQLPIHSDIVEGRVLVEISSALWSKAVGEGLQFSIPQREEVLIGKVTSVDDNIAHTRILEGTLEDGPQEYAFVLTLGQTSTYAHVNTSTGSYELAGTQHYGWLMESANMAPDVDFSLPDHFFIDPDPQDRVLEPEPPPSSDE